MALGNPIKLKKEDISISVTVSKNKKNGQFTFTPSKKELRRKIDIETIPKHMRIKIKW